MGGNGLRVFNSTDCFPFGQEPGQVLRELPGARSPLGTLRLAG